MQNFAHSLIFCLATLKEDCNETQERLVDSLTAICYQLSFFVGEIFDLFLIENEQFKLQIKDFNLKETVSHVESLVADFLD